MSFAGFKKQLNKANQFMSEKIAGAEKTEYDEEFVDLEKTIDVTSLAVDDIITKTNELLQPNPLTRAKQSTAMTVSKMRGQTKNSRYPQPEATLGDCFLKFGRDLGENSVFGNGLLEVGEAHKQLADIKDSLDFNIRQNFLEPLDHLRQKELKEIVHHRKKMQGRRLDYDCKKRKVQKGTTFTFHVSLFSFLYLHVKEFFLFLSCTFKNSCHHYFIGIIALTHFVLAVCVIT
eukprot:XP_011661858.1 PREDICTED: endophilin-A3 isoform X2 [Strongylocentrotus purpuratus]